MFAVIVFGILSSHVIWIKSIVQDGSEHIYIKGYKAESSLFISPADSERCFSCVFIAAVVSFD